MLKHLSAKSRKKTTAQAMVEFALVLPILLLVVYGLIETGRLIFIYASVVTASREAARYGSASGLNAAGTVPRYQDCAGIRAAAKNVGFLNTFTDPDIKITYDRDLGSTAIAGITSSLPGADTCFPAGYVPQNGDRIVVQVTTMFRPMILVGTFSQFPITITTARTLLVSLPIGVDAAPGSLTGSGFALVSITPSPSTYSVVGQTITYTYTIQNQGTTAISGPFTITDNRLTSVDCSGAANPLAGGATTTCTGIYTITQADLDLGSMTNQATALGGAGASNVATATIKANQQPSISLTKSASPLAATAVGDAITYSYTIKNIGNVTLAGPYTITDNKIGSFSCSGALAPGASITCTKTYSVTSGDISTGSVVNTATATTTYNKADGSGTVTVTSNSASATVVTKALYLTIAPSPTSASVVGQIITFTYTLHNNSTAPLSGPFSVTDNKVASVDCSGASGTIAANGGTTSCTGTYAVTQADLDFGSVVNQATATGGSQTSNQASTFVTLTQTPALTLTKSANLTTATTVGITITYTYTLKNTGNVSLTSPYTVTDNKITGVACTGATSPLAPAASTTCSATYVTTQADLDAGSIINTATATATFGTKKATSNQTSTTVITYDKPRLKLTKTVSPTATSGSGQTVFYTYTLTNTGNTALTSPFTITDNKINGGVAFNCSAPSPINIGATTTCVASYTTTLADVTAGSVTNTATAHAMAATATIDSNQASATVTVTTPSPCDLRHSSLKTAPFAMTIFSYPSTTVIVHIASIQVYYNSAGNSITQLSFGGVNIWSGTKTGSPAIFTSPFSGDVSLSPSSNKILQVQFSSTYVPLTSGGEQIVITPVETGAPFYCPILDSSNSAQLP